MRRQSSDTRRRAAAALVSIVLVLGACGADVAAPVPATAGPSASGADGGAAAGGATPAPPVPSAPSGPSVGPELPLPADIPTTTLAAEVGDVIATGKVTPEDGGWVSGRDADGTLYTLEVQPFSVMTDVTVGIRSLAGSTGLGTIVAGADFTPAGLRLLRPAVLTIEGDVIPSGWAAFDYRGDPGSASGHLVIGAYPEAEFVTLVVPHFSGSVAVDLGSSANALYEKWATTRGDDTPTGRQAAAEVRYGAATMAEQNGSVSPETAAGIRDRATSEWIAAERDRLATDPGMLALADGGRPEDLDTLSVEVGRILEFEARRAAAGDPSSVTDLGSVVDILVRYETAITARVLDSAALLEAADSGRVSDIGQILDLFGVIAGLDRAIQLLGGPETPGLAKVFDLLVHVRTALLRSCRQAPVDPGLILGLERFVQLLGGGQEVSFADIAECAGLTPVPTPAAGQHRITGQITFDHTSHAGDRAHAVFDLVLVEDELGRLVFAPGSTGRIDWTLAEPWEGCPATGTNVTTIGTLDNEVVHPLSVPDPEALGFPSYRGADLEPGISLPGFQRGTGDHQVMCLFPSIALSCGTVAFTGRLLHTTPSEWSFACSSDAQDEFWSTGGRLVGSW